jgi:hypothetical protein
MPTSIQTSVASQSICATVSTHAHVRGQRIAIGQPGNLNKSHSVTLERHNLVARAHLRTLNNDAALPSAHSDRPCDPLVAVEMGAVQGNIATHLDLDVSDRVERRCRKKKMWRPA